MVASVQPRDILDELGSPHPGDVHLLSLRCHAATELEDWDLALELAEETSRLASSPDVGAVQRAQVLFAAHRQPEALDALADVGEDNIVASSLGVILRFFDESDAPPDGSTAASSARRLAMPRWSLWFEPILTVLLLGLEEHLTNYPPTDVHRARTGLIRPNLEPSMFRSPKTGLFERLFAGLSSSTARQRHVREREVVGHFHREDLKGASRALQTWILDEENAYGTTPEDDPRRSLLMETYFALGRFADVVEIFERRRSKTESSELSERHLAAYAYLSSSNDRKASKALSDNSDDSHGDNSSDAATAHLTALCELQKGHRGAALGWLRRAIRADDIAMVDLAHEQLEASGIELND